MKKHLITLFDVAHRKWTFSLFCLSVILILAGGFTGITDNPPGIVMVFFGMVFLFLTLIHPWRKPANYLILAGICFIIIVLIFAGLYFYSLIIVKRSSVPESGNSDGILEAVTMLTVLFICAPGIIAGLSGSIIRAFQQKSQVT